MPMPTVFLSYRHENSTHRDRVRQLALRLRASGLEVILDQLANEEQFHRGGPLIEAVRPKDGDVGR
jgi:SEFIR domain